MRATLVVSTYNWPEALAVTLRTAAEQTVLPAEVVVADDGSGEATADLVRRTAADYPVPLRHVWQEDRGFRLARIRNLAVARAAHPYLIIVDGDLVLHPRFVEDHLRWARPGACVRGPRVFLPPELTAEMLAGRAGWPGPFAPGLRKRWGAVRWPWLAGRLADHRADDGGGHCLACWRDDLVGVNGYDERFEGWGREDAEVVHRLRHAGVRKRRLRFAALVCHLHHEERPRAGLARNDELLARTVQSRRTWCEAGLSQHLPAGSEAEQA